MNSTNQNIEWLMDAYLWTWDFVDHRVDGWPLMSSIKPVLLLLALYFIVVVYGPKLMVNRKEFSLTTPLCVYSLSIAIYNLYIFTELVTVSKELKYSWLCEPIRIKTDPDEMRIVQTLYLYFASKLIEFLDTVFIVVRKKNNQLTFLHAYHHSTMFLFSWIGMRWLPGGTTIVPAIINSFVHVIMYVYYALSTIGPNVAKHLWWKRYITLLQLFQFFYGLTLGIYDMVIDCPIPRWIYYGNIFYLLSYVVLFGRFYIREYNAKKLKNMSNHLKSKYN